jgi:hypothetical protein
MRLSLFAVAHFSAHAVAISDLAVRQDGTRLTVDLTKKHQEIDGFGFSEAFQRAYNIYNLTEPKRSALVDLFFNTTSGAGFSILRNGIGSSPNSTQDWMNTIAPMAPSGPNMAPEYVWDGKDSGQLWMSQQAVRIRLLVRVDCMNSADRIDRSGEIWRKDVLRKRLVW